MPKLISDEKLFAIVLYSAFVSNNHLTSVRDVWKSPWITGTSGALAIGLAGAIVAPFILTAIIRGLGFGLGGIAAHSFGSWFMSLYRGTIARGSVVSILQSIGAVGLGALSIFLSSGFGAAIGILIGAIGGFKLAEYLTEINLIKTEEQLLESFVQIEENNNIIIFKIKPALLCNEEALKCFFETFKSSSSFVNSKLFRIDFIENDLKEERIHTVHNLLVDNYEKFRVECIYNDGYLVGYNINLSDYKPSDPKINTLVEIWNVMNGNVVIEFIDKIRDQVNDQIRNVDVNKFRDQVNDQINKADINGFRDHVNNQINQISDQVSKVDINKIRDQVNDHINNIDINKLGSQIGDQVNNQINQFKQVDINKFRDQVNDHVKNINVNEIGNQISNQVNGIFRKWF